MAQKTFVVFVYIIIDNCLLSALTGQHTLFETFHNLLQNRIIEDKLLAVHHRLYIRSSQQFPGLQDDTVGSGLQCIYPQLFVKPFAGKDQHFQFRTLTVQAGTDVHSDGGRSAQSQIQENQIRSLLLKQLPEFSLGHGRTDHLGIGYFVTEDFFCSFQFQLHIFHNNNFKLFHFYL